MDNLQLEDILKDQIDKDDDITMIRDKYIENQFEEKIKVNESMD